jgi:hypothetical protein
MSAGNSTENCAVAIHRFGLSEKCLNPSEKAHSAQREFDDKSFDCFGGCRGV